MAVMAGTADPSNSQDGAVDRALKSFDLEFLETGLKKSPYYAGLIVRDPKKGMNTLLNDIEKVTRPARPRSNPQLLNIAITDMCNLGCKHCPRTYDDSIDLDQLDPDTVMEIIDEVSPETAQVQISAGLGEPLLYDGVFDVIEHAKDQNMRVRMMSNATVLNEEKANRLLDLGIDHLAVSLDGATAETYEKIRVGADFENVISNVDRFCTLRDERDSAVETQLSPVLFVGENLEELPRFIELANEIGVDSVGFNDLIPSPEMEGISTKNLDSASDEELQRVDELFAETRRLAEELGVGLKLPNDEEMSACTEPWHMLTVTTKGKVRPCCTGPWGTFVGDLVEDGIDDIWRGEAFVQWREQMLSDDPQQACVDCQKPIW
jgi:MoaA/NifB/PqqE/SkfB family radical SAM enzyme